MRVVGGSLGGRRLWAPDGRGTRPTSERVRGALFDALEARLAPGGGLLGLRVLDLYAGSGALGIEALSRGCPAAWFVESDPRAAGVLRANLDDLALGGRAHVLLARVERVLAGSALSDIRFGLVVADPPYASGARPVLAALSTWPRRLNNGALCALEHAEREELPDESGTLLRVWSRTYGGTAISVYVKADDGTGTGMVASETGEPLRRRGNTGARGPLSG